MQSLLSELGYLDPPADGGWGPASRWALHQLCVREHVSYSEGEITPEMSDALKRSKPLPLILGRDIASSMIARMQSLGHWVARHPDTFNIVYGEGMNADGTLNDNANNKFNDQRMLIRVGHEGIPQIVFQQDATSEPGAYYTRNPMSAEGYLNSVPAKDRRKGAFHIAIDSQHKAWTIGWYHTHEALRQVSPINGTRDPNMTFKRDPRYPVYGMFGVHHHWGYDLDHEDLGRSSAGCLVGRSTKQHVKFINMLKQDARYVGNNTYRFMASVLDASFLKNK